MGNTTNTDPVRTIPAKVKWRDVIHLDIKDPELKLKTEAFLDKLQSSAFTYEQMDPSTGKRTMKELSGQMMLGNIAELAKAYQENPGIIPRLTQIHALTNIAYSNGKITIADHTQQFTGTVQSGANTMFLDPDGKWPVAIRIGQDYLRGAQYLGMDMRYHPVSVEGVLANEMAHLALRTNNDRISDEIEGIIGTALGGVQRKPGNEKVRFVRDSNGGYQSLLSKPVPGKPKQMSQAETLEAASLDMAMLTSLAQASVVARPEQLALATDHRVAVPTTAASQQERPTQLG